MPVRSRDSRGQLPQTSGAFRAVTAPGQPVFSPYRALSFMRSTLTARLRLNARSTALPISGRLMAS